MYPILQVDIYGRVYMSEPMIMSCVIEKKNPVCYRLRGFEFSLLFYFLIEIILKIKQINFFL